MTQGPAPPFQKKTCPPPSPSPNHGPTPTTRQWSGSLLACWGSWSQHDLLTCMAGIAGFQSCVWGVAQRRLSGGGWRAAVLWTTLMAVLTLAVPLLAKFDYYRVASGVSLFGSVVSSNLYRTSERDGVVPARLVCTWIALAVLVVVGTSRRRRLRAALGVPGSCVGDACAWLWCSPCAVCQEARTLHDAPMNDGVLGAPPADVWGGAAAKPTCEAVALQIMERV